MNVDYLNDEYNYHSSIWRVIRDCISGEKAIKDSDRHWIGINTHTKNNMNNEHSINGNPVYLPMPNPSDQSQENKLRYQQYIERAAFFGATSRTLNGMMGMVFKKPPECEMPDDLEYLKTNVDGSEVGIVGQAHEVARDVISVGRIGLYVDYPATNGETTRAQVQDSGIRATINTYCAESVVDWDCTQVGASYVLSYVKLRERDCKRTDDYSIESFDKYRCLFLKPDESGRMVYSVTVYDEKGAIREEEFTPRDGQGNTLNHIPFYFVGALNNRPSVDDAPLQEIADLNIKHYRNSADFEESAFIVGQPTLFLGGFNESWMKEFYSDGIPFGSRAGIAGPQGSSANLIQAAPNSMPAEGMKHKEQQMINLGARLITSGGQAETAEAARIKHEADASSPSVGVTNINKAYKMALSDVALFMSSSDSAYNAAVDEMSFMINTAFFDTSMTPEQATKLVSVWQSGAIDKATLDSNLKKGMIIPEDTDLEEMNDNISNETVGLDE